jgi:hypothetical protein
MRGWFKDDKLHRMLIEGNAESIYFARDSGKMTISGMQRSLSSRIRADFKDNKVTNMGFYTKPENKYGPLSKFKEDDKILKGFIWKPKERPVSKESIIPSYHKKKAAPKKPPAKSAKGKAPGKKAPDNKAAKDSTQKSAPGKLPSLKTAKDSITRDTVKRPSVIKQPGDTAVKTAPVPLPVVKPAKDTVLKKKPGTQPATTKRDSVSVE